MTTLIQRDLNFDSHHANLARCNAKLGGHIQHYLAVHAGEEFHLESLIAYCKAQDQHIAGDSVSRVMRDLRQRRLCAYELISRSKSLYRALA